MAEIVEFGAGSWLTDALPVGAAQCVDRTEELVVAGAADVGWLGQAGLFAFAAYAESALTGLIGAISCLADTLAGETGVVDGAELSVITTDSVLDWCG